MSLLASIKCICCLVKCSKYLYYIKKIICCITAVLAVITCVCFISNNSLSLKKLKEMF